MGIEPTCLAWKARALPLSYARTASTPASGMFYVNIFYRIMVGRGGFEPPKAYAVRFTV